jgi:hypothetical protein
MGCKFKIRCNQQYWGTVSTFDLLTVSQNLSEKGRPLYDVVGQSFCRAVSIEASFAFPTLSRPARWLA